jgi:hypothetical protein
MRKIGELNFSPETDFWPDVELDGITEDTETDDWHKNLYKVLYRVVLAGAVCSRAFNEPLFSAVETGASIAESLVEHRAPAKIEINFSQDALDYLRQFPAYSPNPAEYEQVFKFFADWLVSNGRARNGDDEGSTVREIIHLLAACEHLHYKICNGNPGWYLGRYDCNSQGDYRNDGRGGLGDRPIIQPLNGFPRGVRKTRVVLFGISQASPPLSFVCVILNIS